MNPITAVIGADSSIDSGFNPGFKPGFDLSIGKDASSVEVAKSRQLIALRETDPARIDASLLRDQLNPKDLFLRSEVALVWDNEADLLLYGRKVNKKLPIASLTKLMTAIVILDSKVPLTKVIKITKKDKDRLRWSKSRLRFGSLLTRHELLQFALAASENRAASALARTFPGGKNTFIGRMNKMAKSLGMQRSNFVDPSGLHSRNTSTAQDLVRLIKAANAYPMIKKMTTERQGVVLDRYRGIFIEFPNTNRLLKNKSWDIELSKTGFIKDSGYCLMMNANIMNRPLTIILLNSWGKYSKYGDANRIRHWLVNTERTIEKNNHKM